MAAYKVVSPRLIMSVNEDIFIDIEIPILNKKTNKTCRTCRHRQRWQCNTKVIQYCGTQKSKRTNNGLLKIKAKNEACFLYENIEI